tara:strand:+ start:587 stop:727 length:141 start_codon:yes stop_codon:yes gene_type:complete
MEAVVEGQVQIQAVMVGQAALLVVVEEEVVHLALLALQAVLEALVV